MVKPKSIWSDQNHFGPTKTVLVTQKDKALVLMYLVARSLIFVGSQNKRKSFLLSKFFFLLHLWEQNTEPNQQLAQKSKLKIKQSRMLLLIVHQKKHSRKKHIYNQKSLVLECTTEAFQKKNTSNNKNNWEMERSNIRMKYENRKRKKKTN